MSLSMPELEKIKAQIILVTKETPSCFPTTLISVIISPREVHEMETKDIILELRKKRGLSQDELATKVMVTRQAVSVGKTGKQFQIRRH